MQKRCLRAIESQSEGRVRRRVASLRRRVGRSPEDLSGNESAQHIDPLTRFLGYVGRRALTGAPFYAALLRRHHQEHVSAGRQGEFIGCLELSAFESRFGRNRRARLLAADAQKQTSNDSARWNKIIRG